MILLVFSALPLFSGSIAQDGRTSYIRTEDVIISISGAGLFLSSESIEAGQIDRFGLVRTLKDPYGSAFSLRPEASSYAFSSKRMGAVLKLGPLRAGASLNDRPMAFAYASLPYAEGAVLYAFPGRSSDALLQSPMTGEDASVLYMATSGGYSIFKAMGILSYSDKEGLSLFGAAGVQWRKYSLFLLGGDAVTLYGDDEPDRWGIRGSFGEEGFRCEFSFISGEPPVFSNDFLSFRAYIRSELEIGGVRLYSSMRYSLSRRGRMTKSDCITVSYEGFRVGYSSSDGIIASFRHDLFEIGIEGRKLYVEITLEFRAEASFEMKLCSDGTMEAGISLVL